MIRDAVWRRLGVPVTIGVARTKTLARLISDTAKPFGALAVTDPDAEPALLARRPVTDVTDIAARRGLRLAPHRICTCLDLALSDRLLVRKLLTRAGEGLWYELNGEPVFPIQTRRPPHKVLSRGGSLGESTADPDRLWAWTVRNLERLVEELEYYRVHAGRLAVWVGYKNDRAGSGETELLAPTARFDLLVDAARACLRRAYRPGAPAARMHLFASRLRWPGDHQGGLFEPPRAQAEAVAQVEREVNAAAGRFALRSGATLYLGEVYKDAAQGYDICDVREKMCF